jgi:hypothetical protein
LKRAFKRGEAPSFFFFPLSFEGEGDQGGKVDKGNIIIMGLLRW